MTRIIIRYYDPSYPYLERAIRSIQGDFDIVVYDDGSKNFPDLAGVKNKYQIRRLEHRGPTSTLIKALVDAKRENVQQVFILDGDDEALESLTNFLSASLLSPYTAVIGQFKDIPSPIYQDQGNELFREAIANLKFCPPCFSLKIGDWIEELPSILKQVQTEYLSTGTLFLGLFLSGQTGISVAEQVIIWRQHEGQTYRHHHPERHLTGQRIWQIYHQKAFEEYSQILHLNPYDAVAYYNRGNTCSRLGDGQKAIEDYTQALDINPNFTEAYTNRGVARFDLGDTQGAIDDYTKALQFNPNFAVAYNNRGNALSKLGKYPEAIADLQASVQLFSTQGDVSNYQRSQNLLAEAYFKMGERLWKQEQIEQAIACYQKSLEVKPEFAESYYDLGMIFQQIGRLNEAIIHYNKVLTIKPEYAKARYQIETILKGYQFSTDWFSRNLDILNEHLEPLSKIPGLNILEIGSWEGRSTCWFLENILIDNSSRIICIDTFAGSLEHQRYDFDYINSIEMRFDFNISRTGAGEKVRKIVGKSQQILRSLPLGFYDLVYIDGSHLASDVLEDAVLSWALVKVGGMIIFDDYDFSFADNPFQNTKVGIDAFVSVFFGKIQFIHKSHQILLKKLFS
ncbi:tetratricopeptide repeat protein [Coleofasciculus sp. FACHB-1120]|uniref:tetratricopeptide repeat protein n=1 Tax=Coleofasciculus sp. FACHB-1120 TaxID=2692783 RepID=UPI00168410B7|nr:tetratricopeptide repeat protein [Coleofasciculus sp. FACHB-1120]MBD2740520.1 tetratricopeptide repeat protein [Coleofasciculus sp. FACHB-1120]